MVGVCVWWWWLWWWSVELQRNPFWASPGKTGGFEPFIKVQAVSWPVIVQRPTVRQRCPVISTAKGLQCAEGYLLTLLGCLLAFLHLKRLLGRPRGRPPLRGAGPPH